MTAEIIDIREFQGHELSVVDHDGQQWLTGEQIGEALEYRKPRKSINEIYRRHAAELSDYSVDLKVRSTDGKAYETRVYNREGVMVITMLSHQPRAREFRRWAVRILKAYEAGDLTAATEAQRPTQPVPTDELLDLYRIKAEYYEQMATGRKPSRAAPVPLTEGEKQTIRQLTQEGMDRGEIARRMGRSKSSVYIVQREAGLK